MKAVTIQLDPALLGALIKISRAERNEVADERDVLDAKVSSLDKNIAYLEGLYYQHATTGGNASNGKIDNRQLLPLSPTGRVRRGQSQSLVRTFLQGLNGKGATITEISKGTGTKYGTTHRLIKLFAAKNIVVQSADKRWHWKVKSADTLI